MENNEMKGNFKNFSVILRSEINPPDYVLEDLVYTGALNYIAGRPGVGKSLWVQDLALHVVKGMPFLGKKTKKGPVIVIDSENSWNAITTRMKRLNKYVQADEECCLNGFVWTESGIRFTHIGVDNLGAKLEIFKPVLVVFDSFIRFFEGDENQSRDVKQVLAVLKPLLDKFGCAILIVHHSTKGEGKVTASALRGSGDILASADSILVLNSSPSGFLELEQMKNRHNKPANNIYFKLVASNNDKDPIQHELIEGINTSANAKDFVTKWIDTNIPINTSFRTGIVCNGLIGFSPAEIRIALISLTRTGKIKCIGKGKWLHINESPNEAIDSQSGWRQGLK